MEERFDFVFSYWIFAWYLLYEFGITSFNPKIALTIGLINNAFAFIIMIYFKNSLINIFLFLLINLFIKIIPLWRLINTKYQLIDIYATMILFILYLLWMELNNIKYTTFMKNNYKRLTNGGEGGPLTYYLNRYFKN
jgi:hypothetical protein